MREERFFVDFELREGNWEIKDPSLFHRLRHILRKQRGEEIILFNGGLKEGMAKIENFLEDKLIVKILAIKENKREPKIFTTLYCSILKKNNFEWVIQKTTEIGIKKIVPIVSKNTVKRGLNLERARKIIISSAEQSGRGTLPEILEPRSFVKALEESKKSDLKILFDSSGVDFSNIKNERPKNISIFIGPEGGWHREEIKMAIKENFEIVNLGKLNLRAETAAIISSFLVIHRFEEKK